MNKIQENNLLIDINRIVQALERIARALDKPDDDEKIEVIKCKDCVYWQNPMRVFCAITDADDFCSFAERKQV